MIIASLYCFKFYPFILSTEYMPGIGKEWYYKTNITATQSELRQLFFLRYFLCYAFTSKERYKDEIHNFLFYHMMWTCP